MQNERLCPGCGSPLPADVPGEHCPKCLMQLGFESHLTGDSPAPATDTPSLDAQWSHSRLQSLFPELELVELLGQGGMGVVWKARQKQLDRPIALKLLNRDLINDPAFAERFLREAQAMGRLSHPAIVKVYDFGRKDEACYFIMEYIDGTSLRQLLQGDRMTADEALAIVPQICDALQYAHHAGIVHRDIKPENILIDRSGQVKIADFGLAKLVSPDTPRTALTGAHQVMGTPLYMAPEQVERPAEVDHRADIYSLGVVIYEMLTGELPLGRFDPPSRKVRIDVRLDEVVLRTLENEPSRRYQQISEVKTDVERCTGTPREGPPTAGSVAWFLQADQTLLAGCGLLVSALIDGIVCILLCGEMFSGRGSMEISFVLLIHLVWIPVALGAVDLLHTRAISSANRAAVLALIPLHYGALVGLPVGIWTLLLLKRPGIRRRFLDSRDTSTAQNILDAAPAWARPVQRQTGAALQILRSQRAADRIQTVRRVLFRLTVWTATSLLVLIVSLLLVARLATWQVTVTDRTAGIFKSTIGELDIRATGSSRHVDLFSRPMNGRRDLLEVRLLNHSDDSLADQHILTVSTTEMRCRSFASDDVWTTVNQESVRNWIEARVFSDVWIPDSAPWTAEAPHVSAAVTQQSALLMTIIQEVAKDQTLGFTIDRSIGRLLPRRAAGIQRYSGGTPLAIERSPPLDRMVIAVSLSLLFWLVGTTPAVRGGLRRRVASRGSRARRRTILLITSLILALWSGACLLLRPLAAASVSAAMAVEFPTTFTYQDPTSLMLADLALVAVWTVGLLLTGGTAAAIWRWGGRPDSIVQQQPAAPDSLT